MKNSDFFFYYIETGLLYILKTFSVVSILIRIPSKEATLKSNLANFLNMIYCHGFNVKQQILSLCLLSIGTCYFLQCPPEHRQSSG